MTPNEAAHPPIFKREILWVIALMGALYLVSGVFIVPANEKGVVRRFGRVVLPPRSSGLQFEFPWPWATVDRVNFHEIRTLTIGDVEADPNFLMPTSNARPATFLTGDKNLLILKINVQYRISEERVAEWLYGEQSPIQRLHLLVETTVTDLVSRSGVDFVHTQGLAELNNRLLREVQRQTVNQRLGCEVEQVTVDRADPPARAKAEFLDVSNARADMARSVHEARGYSEQKLAESQADVRKLQDDAERDRNSRISTAHGAADRFQTLIAQIHRDADSSGRSYDETRQLVMRRISVTTIRDVLEKVKSKLILDGEKPIDLNLYQGRSPISDRPGERGGATP